MNTTAKTTTLIGISALLLSIAPTVAWAEASASSSASSSSAEIIQNLQSIRLQPTFEDGGIFDTEDDSGGEFSIFDYLNIRAVVGGSSGSDISREFSYIRVGGQYSSGPLSVFGNVLTAEATADLKLKLESQARQDQQDCAANPGFRNANPGICDPLEGLEPTRDFQFNYDDDRLDELYLTYAVSDSISLTVGQNRLTLGQFAFASPIHILLPINSEQQIGFSKVDMRVPQTLIDINLYPTERLQVQLVSLLETRVDGAQEEYFDQEFGVQYFDADIGIPLSPAVGYNASLSAANRFADKTQQVFRVLYRPNWGAVGFTTWEGPLHFFDLNYLRIGYGDGDFCPSTTPANCTDYTATAAPDLADATAVAFEIAINLGRWTVIGEFAQVDTQSDISRDLLDAVLPWVDPAITGVRPDYRRDAQGILRRLGQLNQGRSWFDIRYTLLAIGADGQSADGSWTYNLEAFVIQNDLSQSDAFLADLASQPTAFNPAWGSDLTTNYQDIIFPFIHLSKAHTIFNRPAAWGLTVGFFFQVGGILSYYNVDVTDNVSLQFGLELLARTSELDSANQSERQYDVANEMAAALSVALQISF